MTTHVGTNMTANVEINMTTNAGINMNTWPHLNPIFPYLFIGFLTIIYKKPYKKQRFLIQFAKLDRFPVFTKKFQKMFSAIFCHYLVF